MSVLALKISAKVIQNLLLICDILLHLSKGATLLKITVLGSIRKLSKCLKVVSIISCSKMRRLDWPDLGLIDTKPVPLKVLVVPY
jgi:hypothetical protein